MSEKQLQNRHDIAPAGRPFLKMHGLQNDFVIVDARSLPFQADPKTVMWICDRREGVGADTFVLLEPSSLAGVAAKARLFNPDGREVEACGNASRCVGWLLGKETGQSTVLFETLGGVLKSRITGDYQVTVQMGTLRTDWRDIPLARKTDTLHLGIYAGPLKDPVAMNIGNPHAVFFVEDPDDVDLEKYGPVLQKHPIFPEEANIGVAQIRDRHTMYLRVWERPGALTTACGSGACAAVGAARRRGLTDASVMTVQMRAGDLIIEILPDDAVEMTGPIAYCFQGRLPERIDPLLT